MSVVVSKMRHWLPRIVAAPIFAVSLTFIYGFMIWTGYLSLSKSRMLPNYDWVGISNYFRLFASDRFQVALTNIVIFGVLYVGITIVLGVVLAIFLDQKIMPRPGPRPGRKPASPSPAAGCGHTS